MPGPDEVPGKEPSSAGTDEAARRLAELGVQQRTPEQALQDLADLSEDLGLYGEPDAAGELRLVLPAAVVTPPENDPEADERMRALFEGDQDRCPFCGAAMPCPSHRMGGPA